MSLPEEIASQCSRGLYVCVQPCADLIDRNGANAHRNGANAHRNGANANRDGANANRDGANADRDGANANRALAEGLGIRPIRLSLRELGERGEDFFISHSPLSHSVFHTGYTFHRLTPTKEVFPNEVG